MPILDIEIVSKPDETVGQNLAHELAHRAGEVFASPAGSTWVKVRVIAGEHYAENSSDPLEPVYPVFVSILKASLPSPDAMQMEVALLTPVIAQVCNRPEENVHIIYLPEGAGRVAFGGRMVGS